MKNKIIIAYCLSLILINTACNTLPKPLIPGKDECHYCKMPVAVSNFGAELITLKGKLYKFDDIICLIHFLNSGLSKNEKINKLYCVNHAETQNLMDVHHSVFLRSDKIRSPMNSNLAAFETKAQAESYRNDFPGDILTWDQLQVK